MRLISDDGTIDLPYDRVVLEIREEPGEGEYALNCWSIIAYDTADTTDQIWTLAAFFSLDEALGAMRMIRLAYQRSCHWFELRELERKGELLNKGVVLVSNDRKKGKRHGR